MFDSQQFGLPFGPLYISIHGHQRRMIEDEGRFAGQQAVALGAHPSKINRVIVASNQNQDGFQLIKVADRNDLIFADGVVFTDQGSAAMLQVADCPGGILFCRRTQRAVLFHGGRPAVTPFCKLESKTCDVTVVENALQAVTLGGSKKDVMALVIGNICGTCFKHDHESASHLVEPFLSLGETVFADIKTKGLDLFKVIKHRLMCAGVPEERISHAGPCTFETPALSSHRRGDTDRNTIIVVWR